MAEVKQWITVNGQHIPIMEGESKMAAVKKFIKGKRKERSDKATKRILAEYNEKEPTLKSISQKNKLAEETVAKLKADSAKYRKTVKGYNDDPYNRVDKAREARLRASKEHQNEVDQTRALLHIMRTDAKDHVDSNIDDIYDRQKANPSRLEKAKTAYRVQQLNNEYDAKLSDAEYRYASARAKQSRAMDRATNNELTKEYKGYRWSGRNSFSPKVSRALTKLDTNKGVRIDGMIWKKVGPDKFMNENGFKISKWDMANDISKAKKVIYYKKWAD